VNLEVIDIIFIILIAIITIRCALRGFIVELMTMASFVLGIGAGFFFHKPAGIFIREKYMPGVKIIPEILGFIVLFLIVFLAVKLLEYILKDIADRINLGGMDRFLGILFGLVEGVVLVSLVLFVFSVQPVFNPEPILKNSLFAGFLLPYIGTVGRFTAGRFIEGG
jgi:membrane protein required for colicin V production